MKNSILIILTVIFLSGCIEHQSDIISGTIIVHTVKMNKDGVKITFRGNTGYTSHGKDVISEFVVKYKEQPEWAVVGNKVEIVGED